jgi:phenylalanyl-tRNA synthetase beta chain
MKISYNWLKKYIDVDLSPQVVADFLTGCGLEVEGMETYQSVKGGLKGVLIGEVLTCRKHPDSDHLTLTTVNVGYNEPLRIVCGAPNVMPGQKVPVATVGTTLFSNDKELIIKEAKIRGELSQGMICAEDELGLGVSHAGIMVLDPKAIPGTLAKDFFNIEDDFIFEIGLTPNRTDATSHIGVARDLAAVLNNQPGKELPGKFELMVPDVSGFKPDNANRKTEIIIEDAKACPRYSGLTIANVTVKESPDWLKNRLNAIKLRPINNIVDITNFILHETGHPLHAFDADKISGNKVVIKKLPKGTHFVTLDEVDRELSDQDLMICSEKEPMCIAGVFGGVHSGVTEQTKNLFLESAYFDPKTIRKTSKFHDLQTDASFRFERGADYDITVYALKRAALLIKEIAGGEISSEIIDVYPSPFTSPIVLFQWSELDRLAGMIIERKAVKNIIVSLGIKILSETSDGLSLEIPPYKADVLREVDVIEEILRIYGYNNIGFSSAIKSSISFIDKPDREQLQNIVSDFLSFNGFFEIMNNSLTKSTYYEGYQKFRKENSVTIFNPLSNDLDVMRQTLLFGGLESFVYNQNRKNSDTRFYEFGNVYSSDKNISGENPLSRFKEEKHLSIFLSGHMQKESWNIKERNADFYDLKGYINTILIKTGVDFRLLSIESFSDDIVEDGLVYFANRQPLVFFGGLKQSVLTGFDCKQQVFYSDFNWDLLLSILPQKNLQYKEMPKFPEVRRDLALLLDKSVTFASLEKLAFETEKRLLKKVSLFDVYEGEKISNDKKSYALSFILQDESKTLKDEEIDRIMNDLIRIFKEKLDAQIR